MPNKRSAQKAYRQSQRHHVRNLVRKTTLKKSLKDLKKAVVAKDEAQIKTTLSALQKAADKTAKTGYIKKNTAARIKSRAAKFVVRSGK